MTALASATHVSDGAGPLDREIAGRPAWTRDALRRDDWLLPIPDDCIEEITRTIAILRLNPLDVRLLSPDDYPLRECREFMRSVKQVLNHGVGFAILDRLPTDRLTKEELTAAYWLLSSMIAPPVAQSFDGRVLYDVRDTGQKIDTRVRGDLTRQELGWHTDYGFNFPPPHIGLLVMRTGKEGGDSCVSSMMTAHNVLRRRHPDLLARLYRPFHWNRQGEHPPGDLLTHRYPIFERDGEGVRARYIKWLLYKGYELVGEPFDELGKVALETMYDIMGEAENCFWFTLEAGQIQYLNNHRIAHKRTEYVDHDELDAKRHLVRIFLRAEGRRSYMG